MYVVVVYGWQKDEAEVATILAAAQGTVAFEARQKVSGGGPAVVANYADAETAQALATKLSGDGIPALLLDTVALRNQTIFHVRRFQFGGVSIILESLTGEPLEVDYKMVRLLIVAGSTLEQSQPNKTETERKFSFGKTILAGGVPMTKKVKVEQRGNAEDRDETLRLYAEGCHTIVFNRSVVNFHGLGDAMKLTRELNFNFLKSELRRLAEDAVYDDRLLKRQVLTRVLGPALNPATDVDIGCEILARTLFK